MKNNEVTILVSSFDGFADCWVPFLYGFKKYWPSCKYQIYLITNSKDSPDETMLPSLKTSEDLGWASNLSLALESVDSDYIIYLQEDFWLNQQVNQANLERYIEIVKQRNWQFLRIAPLTVPKAYLNENVFPTFGKKRLTLQAGIWEKSFLQSLLFEGESGWDFEQKSTERLKGKQKKTYCVNSGLASNFVLAYCWGTAVRKKKWTRGAVDFIEKENLEFDLTKRKRESNLETALLKLSGKSLLLKIPSFFIIRTIQFVNRERSFGSIFSI